MAKNVLSYEAVYDNIPYHIKERVGFPLVSASLTLPMTKFVFFLNFKKQSVILCMRLLKKKKKTSGNWQKKCQLFATRF